MGRRRKVPEGLVLDLGDLTGVAVDITAIVEAREAEAAVAAEAERVRKKAEREEAKRVERQRVKAEKERVKAEKIAARKAEKEAWNEVKREARSVNVDLDSPTFIRGRLTRDELREYIRGLHKKCDECAEIDCTSRTWGEKSVCQSCYTRLLEERSQQMNEYLESKGLKGCKFCDKPRVNPSDFHFDHVNMFTKSGSVGNMLFNGADIDVIKAEIDKCQLLCVSCHALVTKMEREYGFIYLKHPSRKHDIGLSEADYDEYMADVYKIIREMRGSAGGGGTQVGI